MKYEEYLNSSMWHNLRRKAYQRSNGRCEHCSGTAQGIHHTLYPYKWEDDNLDNLIALCNVCHRGIHLDLLTTETVEKITALQTDNEIYMALLSYSIEVSKLYRKFKRGINHD